MKTIKLPHPLAHCSNLHLSTNIKSEIDNYEVTPWYGYPSIPTISGYYEVYSKLVKYSYYDCIGNLWYVRDEINTLDSTCILVDSVPYFLSKNQNIVWRGLKEEFQCYVSPVVARLE